MTVLYGDVMTKVNAAQTPDPGNKDGTLRIFSETFTLAAQATTDTIVIGRLPKGARFHFGILSNSATLGASATVAIGITGTTGKYRAAAVKTSVTPEIFGLEAGMGDELAAEEEVFITIAVAALPGAGEVRVKLFYTFD